jgi:hypothetical protein
MDILDLRFRCVCDGFISKNSGSTIENLGTPINSTQDDFSFVIDAENKKGFVTPRGWIRI